MSINDTSDGRCTAALAIKGEYFRCDLSAVHDGWGHASAAAEAVWSPIPQADAQEGERG